MQLKRFTASDMTKALRKVKEALGDDAVILSNHSVEDGIEVIAAIDYDDSVVNHNLPAKVTPQVKQPSVSKTAAAQNKYSDLEDVRQEIKHLRELIENQLSGFAWQNISHYHPMQMILIKRLIGLGFEINTAEKLVKSVDESNKPKRAWLSLLVYVVKGVQFQVPDLLAVGGYHALVGPTGVGKTTTIAKLAARFCLQYGAENLGLVTMDGYRIAAVEQLVTFAKILGVNVSVAQNQESLNTSLDALRHKKLVLIDTAGMNPTDPRVLQQFERLSQSEVPISSTLVVSATCQYHVLQNIYRAYQRYDIANMIVTKVDEAQSIGAALSLLTQNKMPLAYFSNGQRVPEDLQLANTESVIQNLISSQEHLDQEINLNELMANLSGSDVYA